jgi:hypothetical protein
MRSLSLVKLYSVSGGEGQTAGKGRYTVSLEYSSGFLPIVSQGLTALFHEKPWLLLPSATLSEFLGAIASLSYFNTSC